MATIKITGELTADSLRSFRSQLAAARGDDLILEIDSHGGSAIVGLSMYADLKNWPRETTAHIQYAASAASVVMCGCRRVVVTEDSVVVTHAPTVRAVRDIGLDVGDLRAAIGDLEMTTTMVAGVYSEKSGCGVEVWLARLKSETIWKGQGIINAGLADAVEGARQAERLPVYAAVTPEFDDSFPARAARWQASQRELLERERERQRGRVFVRTHAASGTGVLI